MKLNETFKTAFPILFPAFVNRVGSVGLDLVPMMLVAYGFTTGASSSVMFFTRCAAIVGNFAGGYLSDRRGLKVTFVSGFLVSALALAALPFSKEFFTVAIFASLAQLGGSLFQAPGRLLIMARLPFDKQREGVAWMRSANNFGYLFAFVISYLASSVGFVVLMLFDAATSLLAALIGYKTVPNLRSETAPSKGFGLKGIIWTRGYTVICALGVVYSLAYRLFITSVSARAQVVFGERALSVFAGSQIINALICTFLAVLAARRFQRPIIAFPLGVALTALGIIMIANGTSQIEFLIASVLASFGEVIIMSLYTVALVHFIPEPERKGTYLGLGLTLQHFGGLAGASLAFPLIVHSQSAVLYSVLMGIFLLLGVSLVRWLPKDSPQTIEA